MRKGRDQTRICPWGTGLPGGHKENNGHGKKGAPRENFMYKSEDNKCVLGKWVRKIRMRKYWSRRKEQDGTRGRKESTT